MTYEVLLEFLQQHDKALYFEKEILLFAAFQKVARKNLGAKR